MGKFSFYFRIKFVFVFLIVLCASWTVFSNEIFIPQDYPTIKAGVEAAENGDTLIVDDGIYFEENIILDKKLHVKAKNPFGAVIQGPEDYFDVIFIVREEVEIEGFMLKHSGIGIQQRGSPDVKWRAHDLFFEDMKFCSIEINDAENRVGSVELHHIIIHRSKLGINTNDANGVFARSILFIQCDGALNAYNHRYYDADQLILIQCRRLSDEPLDAAPYPGTNAIDYGQECYEFDDFSPEAEHTIRSIFGPESYSIRNGYYYNILGKINFQNDRLSDAETWFIRALQDGESENRVESRLESYQYLGLIEEKRGKWEEAVSFQKQAVELIEKIRGDLTSLNARLRYLSIRTDAYEALIRNYYDIYQKDARENYLHEALYFSEQIKSRVLEDRVLRAGDIGRKMEIEGFEDRAAWYGSIRESIGQGSCWVKYFVGQSDLFIFVLRTEKLIMRRITIQADLQDKIENYMVVLSNRETSDEFVKKAGSMIYNILIKPVEDLLHPDIKSLVFIPDGFLSFFPFETLVDEEGRYLLERYCITYGLSVNLKSKRNDKKRNLSLHNIRAFIYPKKVDVIKTIEKDWKYLRSGKKIAQNRRAVLLFPALRYSEREIDHIKSLMQGRPFFEFKGNKATETAFKNLDSTSLGIIHITAHLYYDQEEWRKSFIILHPDEKNGEDGFLQPGEIAELHLNCGLVVIATCKSGLGKTIRGEGFIGFLDAFRAAGASSVVSSLWDLDDRFSSNFMKSFYSLIAEGKNAGEALCLTKISMLNSGFSHPCYWGSLVLHGDPDAIFY